MAITEGKPLPASYASLSTPLGTLWLAGTERGLCYTSFAASELAFLEELYQLGLDPGYDPQALAEPLAQLGAYFAGRRRDFDLPLDLRRLTPFQRAVLDELRRVPFGQVTSYGELARRVGKPGAGRAVGQVMAGNPLPIVIPCHRVIRSDGSLGGFGGWPQRKAQLLRLEGVTEVQFDSQCG
jgi:methylated-DNA-[protein]-cysteine S-methyltransferase